MKYKFRYLNSIASSALAQKLTLSTKSLLYPKKRKPISFKNLSSCCQLIFVLRGLSKITMQQNFQFRSPERLQAYQYLGTLSFSHGQRTSCPQSKAEVQGLKHYPPHPHTHTLVSCMKKLSRLPLKEKTNFTKVSHEIRQIKHPYRIIGYKNILDFGFS